MRKNYIKTILFTLFVLMSVFVTAQNTSLSKSESTRIDAPKNTTFYINPINGSDDNSGVKVEDAWKSFSNINKLSLTEGDAVEIVKAGDFEGSMFLVGNGTKSNPITIKFASGTYNFYLNKAVKNKFNISNTNDSPDKGKNTAIYILNSSNITINGNGADVLLRGKAIYTAVNNSENIKIDRLNFDYKRPTVSEMKVIAVSEKYVDVEINQDSKYEIHNNLLTWIGEGWKYKPQTLWQAYDAENGTVRRQGIDVRNLKYGELQKNKIRIEFAKNPGFRKGIVYQNRHTFRDYSAFFMNRSKNIEWNNCNVYFMHGMGFIGQFSENITFNHLQVKPRENSGRTCAAWADILHFSGCKGQIEINDCYLSAANDDAVNVHGTHLRIIKKISANKILVRFMHPQTYGFEAFEKGDDIEFVNHLTLLPYSENTVKEAVMISPKEMELTLANDVPQIQSDDVVENVTWTPDVTIKNTTVKFIPTRGFLLTTRGKVVVENNNFIKTGMSAILISDDANGWYESGYVRDVTIAKNKFNLCGGPVLNLHPENRVIVDGKPVHKNIKITKNEFYLRDNSLLYAKSIGNLILKNNKIKYKGKVSVDDLVKLETCTGVKIKGNKITNL